MATGRMGTDRTGGGLSSGASASMFRNRERRVWQVELWWGGRLGPGPLAAIVRNTEKGLKNG